jgi:hypothetical protein
VIAYKRMLNREKDQADLAAIARRSGSPDSPLTCHIGTSKHSETLPSH